KNNQLLDKPWQYRFLKPWLGNGLLTASGIEWKTNRQFLNQVFHSELLTSFQPTFNDEARLLVQNMLKTANNNRLDDIYPLAEQATLRIICLTTMGVDVDEFTGKLEGYLNAVKQVSATVM